MSKVSRKIKILESVVDELQDLPHNIENAITELCRLKNNKDAEDMIKQLESAKELIECCSGGAEILLEEVQE